MSVFSEVSLFPLFCPLRNMHTTETLGVIQYFTLLVKLNIHLIHQKHFKMCNVEWMLVFFFVVVVLMLEIPKILIKFQPHTNFSLKHLLCII